MRAVYLLVLFFVFLSNISLADEKTVKIAVIDLIKIEEEATLIKLLHNKVKAREEKIRTDLTNKRKKLTADYEELLKKRSVLDQATLERRSRDIEKREMDNQAEAQMYMVALERAKMKCMDEVKYAIKVAVRDKLSDYDLVLENPVYYNSDNVKDETDKVIDRLNDKEKESKFDEYFEHDLKKVKETKKAAN